MAKYQVNYSCGHSGEVVLFGKHSERERKLEWMADGLCKECWKKSKREEEAAKPITASVESNGLQVTDQGELICEIVLTGGTINKKDEIKALGYRWQEVTGGVMDMLSMSAPQLAWVKTITVNADTPEETIKPAIDELKGIADKIKIGLGPLDIAMAQKNIAEKKEVAARVEAVGPKPVRPECHPNNKNGKWNGKYYGKQGSRNYYMSNINYKMTDEEYDECMTYRAAIADYNAKIEAAKTGEVTK